MNEPHFTSRPDPDDDEQLARERALDEVLTRLRRLEPSEGALRRVAARASMLPGDMAKLTLPVETHSANRSWPSRGYLAAATLAAVLLVALAVWRPSVGPSVAPASPSRDAAPPVASNESPVTSVPLTAISFRVPEADLDVAEQRIEQLTERAMLEELRREAQLAAKRFRDWND